MNAILVCILLVCIQCYGDEELCIITQEIHTFIVVLMCEFILILIVMLSLVGIYLIKLFS